MVSPGSDVLGARASCPQRAEGPQGADRSDTPEPATPPPEARLRERWCPLGAMSWERGHLARNGPKARKAPTGATHLSHPLPRPRHGPGSDGSVSGTIWERGHLARKGRRPARRRQERHARARPRHGPGSDGVPRKRRRPVRLPCGGPAARLRAGRPRSQGRRPSVTRRLCAAGPFQTLGEEVDGSVSGTGSWTSAGHVLVARHPLLPRRARIRWRFEHPRQSDESWCSNPRVTSRWLGDRLFERSRPIRVHLHFRAVERHHLHSHPNEVRTLQFCKHSVQHTGLRPAIHPRVDGVPVPERRRQSTPLASLCRTSTS